MLVSVFHEHTGTYKCDVDECVAVIMSMVGFLSSTTAVVVVIVLFFVDIVMVTVNGGD